MTRALPLGFLVAAACHAQALVPAPIARLSVPAAVAPSPPRPTIAEEILALESAVIPTPPAMHALLREITERVTASLPPRPTGGGLIAERDHALRVLNAIERVLTEENFVYPGLGYTELLHDGLAGVSVDDPGLAAVLAREENHLRIEHIKRAPRAAFHMADCDIYSMLYISLGAELGLPIAMIEIPGGDAADLGHDYVVWTLSDGSLIHWEPDEGMERDLTGDLDHYGEPPLDQARAIVTRAYSVAMTRDEVLGYVHFLVGNEWSDRGAFAEALAEYRLSIKLRPTSPTGYNSASWLLATTPDPALRDPKQAVVLAEQLVAVWPSGNELDTLGAAYASAGRWPEALAAQRRAIGATRFTNSSMQDYIDHFQLLEKCVPYVDGRATEQTARRWRGRLRDPGWGVLAIREPSAPRPPVENRCAKP